VKRSGGEQRVALRLLVAFGLTVTAFLAVNAETVIVVNEGPFPSVEAAASGEASVNWNDADKTDDTACTECYAAMELQHYLRKMTGRTDDFPVVSGVNPVPRPDVTVDGEILLGTVGHEGLGISYDSLKALGPEGYRIKTGRVEDMRVVLIGGGGRLGTMYGVYDFLYRLGCRWYAPGEMHEEIPSLDLKDAPALDVTEKPQFVMRGFHAWEKRGNPDFITWMARNRLNYWCVEEVDHPRLRKLGIKMVWGGHVVGFDYLKPGDPYPYKHPRFDADRKLPADPYPASPDYLGDENNDGVLSYREVHPEWYGMDGNGKRVTTLRDGGLNYCTSNPHATAELMKNAVRQLIDGAAQDAEIVNCWTVDGGRWCTCEACKAQGSQTDRNLRFVHAFDQEVKKAQEAGLINRDITILFLAYHDVLEPPTRPLPDTFDYDTCIATYFPISRSYVNNFDDPDDPTNARYAKHLYGWAIDPDRLYKGQICIGEYYNVSGYKCLPICFMHTMANDIPYYYEKMNARHFHYMHVTTGNWGNKALTNFQMARQLWTVDTDCEELWRDYFAGRYGPAAGKMRAFYESLETMLSNCTALKYRLPGRLSNGKRPIFDGGYLTLEPGEGQIGPSWREIIAAKVQCRTILDEVMAMSLPERMAGRVAEDEGMFTYGERTIDFYDALARAYDALDSGEPDDARKALGEAKKLAALLEADTTSSTLSSSHAIATNALVASRAGAGIATLQDILGPSSPDEYAKLDFSREPCVLSGKTFQGGGAVHNGYGLNVFPGRIPVSDQGNYVYAASTGASSRMTAWFMLKDAPTGPVTMKLTGLSRPVEDGGPMTGAAAINGKDVFNGDIPFDFKGLSSFEITAEASVFKQGPNKIEIRNTIKQGPRSGRPWFGVHEILFKVK
jgi:Domain of unknown function (DUF4838)